MKKLRLYNLMVPIDSGDKALYRAALRRLGLQREHVRSITLTKRAIDARKGRVEYNCTADVEIEPRYEDDYLHRWDDFRNIGEVPHLPPLEFPKGKEQPRGRIVIVGSGPAGLFAAFVLAKQGYRPLLVERGAPADSRLRSIGKFNNAGGPLLADANAMFGEGGAGTFSDGKLYTRKNKDPHLVNVLKLFVEYGASPDILIDAAPHIGTDQLAPVVVAMRKATEAAGAEIRFHARLDNLEIEAGEVRAAIVNGERIECAACIVAIGHSARDTYDMLNERGVSLEARPFQLGVRIEHPQTFIDEAQYGRHAGEGYRPTHESPKLEMAAGPLPEVADGRA
ncbi:MAG: NAD(P)/FAD-dependent oxidoreductase, partial [Planctomycetaceae bacterium]|nr:NAD(P)/FAD-dependent oxidoreductase [Planctomycetaceae bacterium]